MIFEIKKRADDGNIIGFFVLFCSFERNNESFLIFFRKSACLFEKYIYFCRQYWFSPVSGTKKRTIWT